MSAARVPHASEASEVDFEIVIVGSGFSGIGAAISLSRCGIENYLILEREAEAGGTWVQHDYPGLEVDMPFFIYSYPFEPKSDWSCIYPSGRELREYTLTCLAKYDLNRRIRTGAGVQSATWDDAHGLWRVLLENRESIKARYLVNATGLLVKPKPIDLAGSQDFKGEIRHSADWDAGLNLVGRRVAVIGTGATSIQIVPAIADQVAQLDLYQRTPIWLCPKPNPLLSPGQQTLLSKFPFIHKALRWLTNLFVEVSMGLGFVRYTRFPWIFDAIERKLIEFIRSEVDDPEMQEALIPEYSFFCKRPSFSNVFYSTLNRDNVSLVTDPISHLTRDAIQTESGQERAADVVICATGYHVFDQTSCPGYSLLGRNGQDLGDFWATNRFQAFEGATVPGFPNLFLFMGPYSAAGASYFTMVDTQSKHMTRCLLEAKKRGASRIEVRQEAHDRDFTKVDRRKASTALFGGNCGPANSYYFDKHGDTPGLRPVTGFEHWINSRTFRLANYRFD